MRLCYFKTPVLAPSVPLYFDTMVAKFKARTFSMEGFIIIFTRLSIILQSKSVKKDCETCCGKNEILPKVIEEHKTFFRFYKVEEKGESIHATMNDIDRKCWVIKNKQARLWKLIERYELRNVTNVDIVVPLKRIIT